MKKRGLTALGCYAIHAGFHILNGRPEEILWMCHLGAALVGVGLLSSSAITNGIGALFLCIGLHQTPTGRMNGWTLAATSVGFLIDSASATV